MRHPVQLVVILIAVLLSGPTVVLAQGATPVTGPVESPLASSAAEDRTDLAAMVLGGDDVPAGFSNVDERYFLSAQGVSTFYSSQALSAEEIAATGLVSMYDSIYPGDEVGSVLVITITEFRSPYDV